MARFAKPLQGPFSPVAKHPQKHKNRPEIGRFSHFNPSAEMHPFSLFSASKAPEKWLCDAICRKKQLFPTSRSGFLILHECLQRLGYFTQKIVVERLCVAVESNPTVELLLLFVRVAEQFLKLSFSRTEGGATQYICTLYGTLGAAWDGIGVP